MYKDQQYILVGDVKLDYGTKKNKMMKYAP